MIPCHVVGELVLSAVRKFVRSVGCDCIALSGGIDTSFIALAARLEGLRLKAVTVYYVGAGVPSDLYYAIEVARSLGVEHHLVPLDNGYVAERARVVVECTGRRDYIEVRNGLVFLRAIEEAERLGCSCLLLGDGGDEVFAGYGFMVVMGSEELAKTVLRMAVRGRYPGLELAECTGFPAYAPLLSDEVLEAALPVTERCARSELLNGKEVLRAVLERYGLWRPAFREKTPAERGAGTDTLDRSALEKLAGLVLDEPHG